MVTGSTTIANKTYEFDSNGKWVSNLGPSQDKLQATPNFSWFTDNGNTYFKTKDNIVHEIYSDFYQFYFLPPRRSECHRKLTIREDIYTLIYSYFSLHINLSCTTNQSSFTIPRDSFNTSSPFGITNKCT